MSIIRGSRTGHLDDLPQILRVVAGSAVCSSATCTPAVRNCVMFIVPLPSRMLARGLWMAVVPVSASRAISSGLE